MGSPGGMQHFFGGMGRMPKPRHPCARAAAGTASAASPARPWMASAWRASPAGTGPCARSAAPPASTARAASSRAPAAGTGTPAMRRPGRACTASLAGWDPGTPPATASLGAGCGRESYGCPGGGPGTLTPPRFVSAAATAPAPRAPLGTGASSSAPSAFGGAATPYRVPASARPATGDPGNVGRGAGQGPPSPGAFPLLSSLFQLQRHLPGGVFWRELFLPVPVLPRALPPRAG